MDEVAIERISWREIGELIGWVEFIETFVLIGLSIALLSDPSTYLLYLGEFSNEKTYQSWSALYLYSLLFLNSHNTIGEYKLALR